MLNASRLFTMTLSDHFLPNGNKTLNSTGILAQLYQLSPSQWRELSSHLGPSKIAKLKEFLQAVNGVSPSSETVSNYDNDLMQYTEYRVQSALLLYVPPVLILLGTFGNIFAFIILKRKAMLKFSTYFYLMVLALVDTLVLYIGLLQLWIAELTGFELQVESQWLCKLTALFGYTASDFSVWLIIAVTVERYIVVCHPLRAATMCSSRRARNVVISLLVVMLTLNMHFIWTVNVNTQTRPGQKDIRMCEAASRHEWSMRRVWPWFDVFVYSLLPFASILALNGLIIRQVLVARQRRHELRSDSVYSQRRPSREGNTRLTLMLLTISFAFLITTLPLTVVNIGADLVNIEQSDIGLHGRACFKLARTVSELLMYLNHSMNFFLYCATGQKFRHQLVWLVCYARRGPYWPWSSEPSQPTTRLESVRYGGKIRKSTNDAEMFAIMKHDIYVSLKLR